MLAMMSCEKCAHLNRGKDGNIILKGFDPDKIPNYDHAVAAAEEHNSTCACTAEGQEIRKRAYQKVVDILYEYTRPGLPTDLVNLAIRKHNEGKIDAG